MDIITTYVTNNKENKLKVSKLFTLHKEEIQRHNEKQELEDATWKDLEKIWIDLVAEYLYSNDTVVIKKDFHKVDFAALLNSCKVDIATTSLTERIVDESTKRANKFAPKKMGKAIKMPCLTDDAIQTKLNKKKKVLEKEEKTKDILSIGVLDFISKNKNNGTMESLGKSYDHFKNMYTCRQKYSKRVGQLCQEYVVFEDDVKLKLIINKAKEKLCKLDKRDNDKREDVKVITSLLKVYKKRNKKHELEYGSYNETEYLFFIIEPMLSCLFKDYLNTIQLKCGESYLKIAAQDDNNKLYEEEYRSKGPKIDLIIRNIQLKIDISVLEISGANTKVNQIHFLEDRLKIAKNLKIILSNILKCAPHASIVQIRKIKLYGFHIYENKFHVYSLSTPDDINMVFVEEKCIEIPTCQNMLKTTFPTFVSAFWCVKNVMEEANEQIEKLFQDSTNRLQISSESSSDDNSLSHSAKKQKMS